MRNENKLLAILPALNMFKQIQEALNQKDVDEFNIKRIIGDYNENATYLSCTGTVIKTENPDDIRVYIRFTYDASFMIQVNKDGWTSFWT